MILTTVLVAASALTVPAAAAKSPKAPQARNSGAPVVLGKLGQTKVATPILAAPSRAARVFYTSKPSDYLVIRTHNASWVQVLMQNGAYGYAEAARVTRLPYNVTSKAPSTRSTYVASRGSGDARSQMADFSLNFQGTPYVWGGNDPTRGIDCSGFVKAMYGKIGLQLPRTAAEQALVGAPIYRLEELRKGDRLYFWDSRRAKIGHTGIYMGDGTFVHSSSGHNGVARDRLDTQRWLRILVAARR